MEPDKQPSSTDRYDVTGNVEAEYVDQTRTVMVNKLGVTDLLALERLEEEGLFHAYETLLAQTRTDTPMTAALLRHIHHQTFGELYEWAGRWRTVSIIKPGAIKAARASLVGKDYGPMADLIRQALAASRG